MAKHKCKGTVLKVDIAATLTAVAQLITLKTPNWRSLDTDTSTLDTVGTGQEFEVNGWTEHDDFEAEIFWDPDLAVHAAILAEITTPDQSDWQIVFVDGAAPANYSELDFDVAGLELSPVIDMKDALKASVKGKVTGVPVLTVN